MIDRYKSLTTSLTNIENNEIYWKNPCVQSIRSVLSFKENFLVRLTVLSVSSEMSSKKEPDSSSLAASAAKKSQVDHLCVSLC